MNGISDIVFIANKSAQSRFEGVVEIRKCVLNYPKEWLSLVRELEIIHHGCHTHCQNVYLSD